MAYEPQRIKIRLDAHTVPCRLLTKIKQAAQQTAVLVTSVTDRVCHDYSTRSDASFLLLVDTLNQIMIYFLAEGGRNHLRKPFTTILPLNHNDRALELFTELELRLPY